jgi:sialate O-acetylesterase
LARPFSDHMVLQQKMKLPVWGTAPAGQTVAVKLGEHSAEAKAADDGQWRVDLPPLETSAESLTMSVTSGDEETVLKDILVGEVWLAAGQSNMDFPVKRTKTGRAALKKADRPNIRLLDYRKVGWKRWSRNAKQLPVEERMAEFRTEDYFSGSWEACSPKTAADFAAVAYYFGVKIQEELDVPVGLINVAVGGTPCEAWTRRELMADHPQLKALVQGNWLDNKLIGGWPRNWGRKMTANAPGEVPTDELGPNHCCKPGFLWEAGIRPLIPYAIRGVIWYQGESNAAVPRLGLYPTLFPAMVEDWRRQWGQGDFPFLYVQLTAFNVKSWPQMRQAQLSFLDRIPAAGMAVTMDVGHRTNIHPGDKEPIGLRLALWALGTTYEKKIVYSGPLLKACERRDGSLVVSFRHTGSGLSTTDGKAPVGFEVAGEDGKFVSARAEISGDTVVVAADGVEAPTQVRYGWSAFPNPPLNLCNKERLPASPFAATSE